MPETPIDEIKIDDISSDTPAEKVEVVDVASSKKLPGKKTAIVLGIAAFVFLAILFSVALPKIGRAHV